MIQNINGIMSDNDTTIFEHCTIEYAKSIQGLENDKHLLLCQAVECSVVHHVKIEFRRQGRCHIAVQRNGNSDDSDDPARPLALRVGPASSRAVPSRIAARTLSSVGVAGQRAEEAELDEKRRRLEKRSQELDELEFATSQESFWQKPNNERTVTLKLKPS